MSVKSCAPNRLYFGSRFHIDQLPELYQAAAKYCDVVACNTYTWSVDGFRCIQCGACVRECPKHSLTMEPTYTAPAATKTAFTMNKPQPSEEELAAKAAEREARIAAAKAAKAAREAAKEQDA